MGIGRKVTMEGLKVQREKKKKKVKFKVGKKILHSYLIPTALTILPAIDNH